MDMACGTYYEATRAHIDESWRSREMVSGNWPVKFCPLRSLQESALTVNCVGNKSAARRAHMRVILPMHRRSPSAAGTVPMSFISAAALSLEADASVAAKPVLTPREL